MATHMRSSLVVDAFHMALARRRPDPGLIHHSDQGGSTSRSRSVAPPTRPGSPSQGKARFTCRERGRRIRRSSVARRSAWRSWATSPSVSWPRTWGSLEHALARRLRTAPTLSARRLRAIARTTKININNQPVGCHANRGRSKAGVAGLANRQNHFSVLARSLLAVGSVQKSQVEVRRATGSTKTEHSPLRGRPPATLLLSERRCSERDAEASTSRCWNRTFGATQRQWALMTTGHGSRARDRGRSMSPRNRHCEAGRIPGPA
jgi:hypothetical protein